MIRVKSIHIEEFRGIRKLDLDLDSDNFGICGHNGTGKSGVVDAIEFCLTGDVTRLSGEGSSGLSVKEHASHVDQHDTPHNSSVTIKADAPSLQKSITIRRSAGDPRKVEYSPNDANVKKLIEDIERHPEFALSRREIVKYIITPAGQRSKDVQTLLRLDYLEKLRQNFTTFYNTCKNDADEARRNRDTAEGELKRALGLAKLERAAVLQKVNEKRKLLNLEEISELKKTTSFKEGISKPQGQSQKPVLNKATALADFVALEKENEEGESSELSAHRSSAKKALEKLRDDENALVLARRHGFIKTGLEFVTTDACPLCDTEWDAEKLRQHLKEKLLSAREIEKLLVDLQKDGAAISRALSERTQLVQRVVDYCGKLKPAVVQVELATYLANLSNFVAALANFQKDKNEVQPALQAVSGSWWSFSPEENLRITECKAGVKALPELSAEDKARDELTVAQERYEKFLAASTKEKTRTAQKLVADKVRTHYNESRDRVLEKIYEQVAKDFTAFYRKINHDDEQSFVGKLKPLHSKLDFDVDFYGRGLFPPGAYHSEGHQDSMGLCLYLALMKHTLGNQFTLAVLDDVLMSVDTGHRREVCRLLKAEFPKTQFIITTHDRVWLQYMKTENLLQKSVVFSGWTVDSGPRVWGSQDVWSEIKIELDKGEVSKASSILRRYLEYTGSVLADNLRARIEYRGDGVYDLGELLPTVLKEWRSRLEDGEKAATHWKLDGDKAAIAGMRAEARRLVAQTSVENWTLNKSLHFNEWENFTSQEFARVVDTFKELIDYLRCKNQQCGSYVYVQPRKGKAEAMRCNCGAVNINLKTD